MSKETFILLDQQNGGLTTGSGSFQVAFAESVLLEPNAQLIVSDAYIDARQSGQGAFEFPDPFTITITLAYSMYDFSVSNPPDFATSLRILCQAESSPTPNALYTQDLNITIPAGVYSATDLAEFITRQATKLPDQFYGGDVTVADSGLLENLYKPPLFFPVPSASPTSEPNAHRAGTYPGTMIDPVPFSGLMSDTDTGTTQFSLSFTGSRFSFTNLHRPCITEPGAQPCVYLKAFEPFDPSPPPHPTAFLTIPYVSAVHLYDLQPQSFWQSLGFNTNAVTIRPNLTDTGNLTLQTFFATTTRGFIGIDALPLSKGPNYNNIISKANWPRPTDPPVAILTQQVSTVDASFPPQYDSDGFFLLDVQLLPARANTVTSGACLNTCALVSRVLTSTEGYAFNVSSIALTNTSDQPLLISGAKVTVLNASSRQPYSGLGVRNSVILKMIQ